MPFWKQDGSKRPDEDTGNRICRPCAMQTAGRSNSESQQGCAIAHLERQAMRDLLQVNMELDLNICTVEEAYMKTNTDCTALHQVRQQVG